MSGPCLSKFLLALSILYPKWQNFAKLSKNVQIEQKRPIFNLTWVNIEHILIGQTCTSTYIASVQFAITNTWFFVEQMLFSSTGTSRNLCLSNYPKTGNQPTVEQRWTDSQQPWNGSQRKYVLLNYMLLWSNVKQTALPFSKVVNNFLLLLSICNYSNTGNKFLW